MTTTVPASVLPSSAYDLEAIVRDFRRDGFRLIRGVFSPDEVAALKKGIDRVLDKPTFRNNRYQPDAEENFITVRMFETDPLFVEVLTKEPLITLVDSLLGSDCHLVAQNAVRNKPGQAIDFFHADDLVIAPLPEEIPRHDARQTMPVFLLTLQIPLTDIPGVEYGPTEYVPGSHYSGRNPNDATNPSFEGKGPVPVLCKAGDVYLHNGQCWHRGAPNTSDTTRYLFQMAFGMRWVSQRFFPFMNYNLPDHVLASLDDRERRILGFHPTGAYG